MRRLIYPSFILLILILSSATQAEQLTARERLQKALTVSRDLASRGVKADPEAIKRAGLIPAEDWNKPSRSLPTFDSIDPSAAIFPTLNDMVHYEVARPWSRFYRPTNDSRSANNPNFPTQRDAPALRELLADPDPEMRSVAIEALAVLQEPEDVERIAELLDDTAAGAPSLEWNRPMSALPIYQLDKQLDLDSPTIMRGWRTMTVSQYAKRSIKYMTGEWLDSKSFPVWWENHSNGRQCLWYWQQRISHGLREIDESFGDVDLTRGIAKRNYGAWLAEANQKRTLFIQGISRELRRQPPEVEAKVELLVVYEAPNTTDTNVPARTPFVTPFSLRIGHRRLMDLLDGRNLWLDVDWSNGTYNNLAIRIALYTTGLRRQDVRALRRVLTRENEGPLQLFWDGRAAIRIGISRLLPHAKAADLDDPDTMDGTLRAAIRQEKEVYTRAYAARELARAGQPADWPFLKDLILGEEGGKPEIEIGSKIILGLGDPPLTPDKKNELLDLLQDKRFWPLWTQYNSAMGMDAYRMAVTKSVNALAGKEIITYTDQQDLGQLDTWPKTLPKAIGKARSAFSDSQP